MQVMANTTSTAGTTQRRSLLQQVEIASPCAASWEDMVGDDRVRFCLECNRDVFNLSAVTEKEAEHILLAHGFNLCARLYRRRDGTYLTADCPTGLRAARLWFHRTAGAVVAAVLAFVGWNVTRPATTCLVPEVEDAHNTAWTLRHRAVEERPQPRAAPGPILRAVKGRDMNAHWVGGGVAPSRVTIAAPAVTTKDILDVD
jgi:hypothetical protein